MKIFNSFFLFINIFGLMISCGKKAPTKEEVSESLIPTAGMMTTNTNLPNNSLSPSDLPENPLHRSLIGTFWRFEDFDIQFLNSKKLFISGGVINKVSTKGIECEYTLYDNGIIDISILGIVKTGLWDGKKLVIDGMVGIQKKIN